MTPGQAPDPYSVGGAAYRRSSRHRKAVVEQFEIFMGFLGFWGVVLLGVTAWLEITGQFALGWALGLLAVVLAMAGLWALRRKVLRGAANDNEE
ncbi:hypothetical protein [Sinomonas atrocyanea]|uniref:hypothetical protein n=1 Tax=Sinomonas atrocyanea TaxID=37927 RepID=UPI003D9872D2